MNLKNIAQAAGHFLQSLAPQAKQAGAKLGPQVLTQTPVSNPVLTPTNFFLTGLNTARYHPDRKISSAFEPKRTIVIFVDSPPAGATHYTTHGTSSGNAKKISQEGFNLKRNGENFGGYSSHGPFVYTDVDQKVCAFYATKAFRKDPDLFAKRVYIDFYKTEDGELRTLKHHIDGAKFFSFPGKKEAQEAGQQHHEVIGPSTLGGKGRTTLLSEKALSDDAVVYYAVVRQDGDAIQTAPPAPNTPDDAQTASALEKPKHPNNNPPTPSSHADEGLLDVD